MALIDIILDSPEVLLDEMLQAREQRAERQRIILSEHQCPLVCITLNMPGSHKAHSLAEKAFYIARQEVLTRLSGAEVPVKVVRDHLGKAGFEGFYAVDGDARAVKSIAVTIEESHPIGRLFDIDVIDRDGVTLRGDVAGRSGRKCLICGGPVWVCSRSRRHSAEELSLCAASMIQQYIDGNHADHIAAMATRALLYTVGTISKPGLPYPQGSGARQAMDFFSFIDCSVELTPYFRNMALRGMAKTGGTDTMLPDLRHQGIWPEETGSAATGGDSTLKKVLLALGFFCTVVGYIKNAEIDLTEETLFNTIQGKLEPPHGRPDYAGYGTIGIGSDAAAGYPHVRYCGLPALQHILELGHSHSDAGVFALLQLMSHVVDTGSMSCTDPDTVMKKVQLEIPDLLETDNDRDAMVRYKEEQESFFYRDGSSPDDFADLLALCFFCHFVL